MEIRSLHQEGLTTFPPPTLPPLHHLPEVTRVLAAIDQVVLSPSPRRFIDPPTSVGQNRRAALSALWLRLPPPDRRRRPVNVVL